MKNKGKVFLIIAAFILLTGCGNKEEKLICSNSETSNGLSIKQTISMTFKNDKINHMKMDVNSKITDETLKTNWDAFKESMDSQNLEKEKDGVSLKVTKDDKNYEYIVTLDVDITKAKQEDLKEYNLEDLTDDKSTLEDNKKVAEKDGFTCKVEK